MFTCLNVYVQCEVMDKHTFIVDQVLLWLLIFVDMFKFTSQEFDRRILIPKFYASSTNVTYERGGLAVLYCSIENLGTKTVIWRKHPYNVPITIGEEQFLEIDRFYLNHVPHRDQWNLLIKNVQTFDAGTYECQISSTTKVLRKNITLNVIERGKSSSADIQISGTRFVEKGADIFLMCNASGTENPPEGIDWFKDGNLLTTKKRSDIQIEKQISMTSNTIVSKIRIKNAFMKDTGTYVCRTSELLTTRFKVDVLNAETFNVKRDFEELSHSTSVTHIHSGCRHYFPSGHFRTILIICLLSYHSFLIYPL